MVAEVNPRGNTFRVIPAGALADASRTLCLFAHTLCQETPNDGTAFGTTDLVIGPAALTGFAPVVPFLALTTRPDSAPPQWELVQYFGGGSVPGVIEASGPAPFARSLYWRVIMRGDGGGACDYVVWVSEDGLSWQQCAGVPSTMPFLPERVGLSGQWANRSLLDWMRVYDLDATVGNLAAMSIAKPLTGGRLFVP